MQQQELIVGDSLSFLTSTPGYPAGAGWVLKYRLVPRAVGPTPIELTATAEGDDHRVAVNAAATAAWTAGEYGWASWVELADEKYTVASGQITLKPDPRTVAAGTDTRSATEVALANVEAMLAGKASSATKRYRIGDRELESYAATDLIVLRDQLRLDLRRERRAGALAAGLPDPAKTYVRLTRA